jgi:hypothetical protein
LFTKNRRSSSLCVDFIRSPPTPHVDYIQRSSGLCVVYKEPEIL